MIEHLVVKNFVWLFLIIHMENWFNVWFLGAWVGEYFFKWTLLCIWYVSSLESNSTTSGTKLKIKKWLISLSSMELFFSVGVFWNRLTAKHKIKDNQFNLIEHL